MVAHVLGPVGAPPPGPCPPLDGTIGALDRIADACPVCWALIPTGRLEDHVHIAHDLKEARR